MQIYWWVMTGLLLFPWTLVLAPAIALTYRRLSSADQRDHGFKHRVWIFLALFILLAGATLAFAAEPVGTPIERLQDGARDLAIGWTRFFQAIAVETVERGPVEGFLFGIIDGSHQSLSQTTQGAYEAATFFLPVPRPQPRPSEPGNLLEVRF